MSLIYGLSDPRVSSIRYVGKTRATLKSRLSNHMAQAKYVLEDDPHAKKTRLHIWLASLLREGIHPDIRTLEECDEEIEDYLEIEWIANMRLCGGPEMVNGTDGGEGGQMTEDTKAKLSAAHKAIWEDPEYRAKRAAGPADRSWKKTEENRAAQSERSKAMWATPGFREKFMAVHVPAPTTTHCPQGHEYTEENTGRSPDGKSKWCRICKREKGKERHRRKAELKRQQREEELSNTSIPATPEQELVAGSDDKEN